MKRRVFIETASAGAIAGALADIVGTRAAPAALRAERFSPQPGDALKSAFTPCINQATTMHAPFRAAMNAYAKAGFSAVELWLGSLESFLKKESPAAARRVITELGLDAVSACCEGDLFFPRVRDREKRMNSFQRKLELSATLGAPRFVMYSAIFEDVTLPDYEAAVPRLRELGDLAEGFGVRLGIEFIRGAKFLGCLETTATLLRAVAHPHLGVLVDTFHFYAGTSKLTDIEKVKPGEISFVHIDDVPPLPRELLEDKHRVFVGEGVMPLPAILRGLASVYRGPVSFEVFQYGDLDPYPVAKRGFEGLSRLLARLDKSIE